jgi:hypothetical protein
MFKSSKETRPMKSMPDWPADADGDLLRWLWHQKMDFSAKRQINFQIGFDTWPPKPAALELLRAHYHTVDVLPPNTEGRAFVQVSKNMALEYDAIVSVLRSLTNMMRPFSGWCECWGTDMEAVALTRERFHVTLVKETFKQRLSDEEALSLMAVLHLYKLGFRAGTLSDAPDASEFAALTQRSAAAVIASLWPETKERSQPSHWYWAWHSGKYYECLEEFSAEQREKIEQMKSLLETHPTITALTLDV